MSHGKHRTEAVVVRLRVLAVLGSVLAAFLLAIAPVPLPLDGGLREAEAAPTFRLPWKDGQRWYVTADNASANHNDPQFYPHLNRYAFDAQPLGEDPSVVAIAKGEVVASINTIEYSDDEAYKSANSGGNCVAIDHGDGVYSMYAHMETGSVSVRVGQEVEPGQAIGRAGRTGFVFADSPLLHWTVTSTEPDSRCLNGLSSQSTYADVGGDGIPQAGNSYTSGNTEEVNNAEPGSSTPTLDLDVLQWCRDYYDDPAADAYALDPNNPYTWVCETNGEQLPVDMMNAAERQYGPGYCAHLVGPTAYDWKAGPC